MSGNIAVDKGSWFFNPRARDWAPTPTSAAASFHAGLPDHERTPVVELPTLAAEWGVARVVVKDESTRFGLPAFKALGVSYAIYRLIREHAGDAVRPADWNELHAVVDSMPPMELVTATDGNHGRAVARFASRLGIPARVFVPDVVSPAAIESIRSERADVVVLSEDYDTTVRRAAEEAESRPSAVLLQDTAWPGYETVPQWIVEGYATLFSELDAQLALDSDSGTALVVVPVGVGSLAQAAVTHYRCLDHPHALLGVEPNAAACVQASLLAGRVRSIAAAPTIMAGLNCGTPSSLAWPHLRAGLDAITAISDEQADEAARELNGFGVSSGPCGAASLAAAKQVLGSETTSRREELGLSSTSVVVLLNTEGAHETTGGPTR